MEQASVSPPHTERNRPKILFAIWALEVGGAERFLVNLVPRIPRDRFEVKVVCLARKGVWAPLLEGQGIPVLCLDKRVGLDLRILPRLLAFMRREQPDLVNTHLWTADLWARLAAILAGVPHIVVTEQNVDVWKTRRHRLLDRLLLPWTQSVICVSEEVCRFYRREIGVPEGKLQLIPNAVDMAAYGDSVPGLTLREEVGASPTDFIFLCLARLHPQKGHDVLLEATRLVAMEGARGFRLLLAGDGPLRAEIESQVTAKGLAPWVRLLGVRNDVPALLRQADGVVLSSRYEGLPLAVLEAMAAGRPVVATRVGGMADVVEDGRTGVLVPPGDAVALATAMRGLLGDPQGARAMGQEGRRRVARDYDIGVIAQRTVELFEECLGLRSQAPTP